MHFFITGGAGFIGSNLVKMIVEKFDYSRITLFDNFSNNASWPEELRKAKLLNIIEGDIRDHELVNKSFQDVDVVIHLAAQTGVLGSLKNPIYDCEMNILATLNLLNTAHKTGCKSFVAASSNACVGEVKTPFDEESLPRPVSFYGASKLSMENYIRVFNASSSMNATALRFSNVYGPMSSKKGSVVSAFLKSALSCKTLKIEGDGLQTRDFIHVTDICNALLSAITFAGCKEHARFCIGTGREESILNLAYLVKNLILDRLGIEVQLEFASARVGDVKSSYSDINLARRVLNFEPTMSLDLGVAETLDSMLREINKGQNHD